MLPPRIASRLLASLFDGVEDRLCRYSELEGSNLGRIPPIDLMEFSWRTPFSRGPSDVQLTGVLGNGKNWGMYGEYQNDSKVPRYEPHDPPLEYRKDYPALPATRPVNFPHIIDMDRYYEKIQRQNLRMADAVVTVLYNWEQEALAAFLDLDREDFRFRVEMKGVNPLDFFIERKHRRVEAG